MREHRRQHLPAVDIVDITALAAASRTFRTTSAASNNHATDQPGWQRRPSRPTARPHRNAPFPTPRSLTVDAQSVQTISFFAVVRLGRRGQTAHPDQDLTVRRYGGGTTGAVILFSGTFGSPAPPSRRLGVARCPDRPFSGIIAAGLETSVTITIYQSGDYHGGKPTESFNLT